MRVSLKAALPLFDHLSEIAARIESFQDLLLFVDFDGTLAPIADDPARVSLPPETRQALARLAALPKFSVAVISGRALPDLRERVGLENLFYAGNHGLEIRGPGVEFVEPAAALRLKALGELSRNLRTLLHDIPGVAVENKVLSASVHYRRAPAGSFPRIRETVDGVVGSNGRPFEVTLGRKVLEIRPRVDWNKGMAVRWIRESLGKPDALSLYVGDDLTDEDAFSALPRGITISIGRDHPTSAHYYIERQESVQRFLDWLGDR